MLLISSMPSSRAKSFVLSVHVQKGLKKRYAKNISFPIPPPPPTRHIS